MSLARLAFGIDEPGWSSQVAKDKTDVFSILGKVAQVYDDVWEQRRLQSESTSNPGNDIFFRGGALIRGMRANWLAEFAGTGLRVSETAGQCLPMAVHASPLGLPIHPLADMEIWMQNFFEVRPPC